MAARRVTLGASSGPGGDAGRVASRVRRPCRSRLPYTVCKPSRDEKTVSATLTHAALAEQEICREALIEKYAKGGESSVAEVRRRVARALAQVEQEKERAKWEQRFAEALEAGFI